MADKFQIPISQFHEWRRNLPLPSAFQNSFQVLSMLSKSVFAGVQKRPDVAQAGRRRNRSHFAANRPRSTFLNRALLPFVLISRVMAA